MSGLNHAVKFGASKATFYEADPELLNLITDEKHALYDPRVHAPVNDRIVRSMVEYGWIGGAIEVATDGDKRNVSKGRQRVKAARVANAIRRDQGLDPIAVPYSLKPKGTEQHAYNTGVLENTARVLMGPASMAREAATMKGRGYPDEQIAFLTGIPTIEAIPRYLLILDCCAEMQAAIERGDVPLSMVPALAKLSHDEQRARLTSGDVKPKRRTREPSTKPRPPTIPALTAMSSALNGETGKLRDLLAYLAGGEHGLSAAVVAKLDEARKGVKPGVKPGKASAS